ncbi:MAG: PEP/pyruvate-binding domain-containing protein [Acidimicrobiales bacterium]
MDDGVVRPELLGAKAANLARARAAGLRVLDGFVIPPAMARRLTHSPRSERSSDLEAVRSAWGAVSRAGAHPVVVRSSSLTEDTATSSQAGVFESVVDVHGWDDFLDAVRTVTASGGSEPIAVLVQRHLDPARSGVLFTTDPVSGRSDRLVVAVVEGGPQALVSGAEAGTRLVLDRRARVVERSHRSPLGFGARTSLVRMARRAEALLGGPQDIEWAIDTSGRLHLLQSRPITTVFAVPDGPVFGPGPVAETFPDPLRSLEQDLWLTPLREALRVVLTLTGGAPRRALDRSPVVIAVDGRAAIDLDLLEGGRTRRRGMALLDPRLPMRHLRVAWQVGRLRSGLPGLIDDLIAEVDRQLAAVPPLDALDDRMLLRLLERTRDSLRAAHGYELLAGTLTADAGATVADLALAATAAGRRRELTDEAIIAAAPAALALIPPSIGPLAPLPDVPIAHAPAATDLGPREALRLRIRWLHELSSRASWTLGARLAADGRLPSRQAVAGVDLPALTHAIQSGVRMAPADAPASSPPLPSRFRLTAAGQPVALHDRPGHNQGTGAGGGRASGVVAQGPNPPSGSVLVVATLDPRLAPVLAGLGGLVAETGSPLSHLAILAREHGVATVVGVDDALRRFPAGTELLVDGATGEVRALSDAPATNGAIP